MMFKVIIYVYEENDVIYGFIGLMENFVVGIFVLFDF